MKRRFLLVDLGRAVHKPQEACPPFCHFCPHMRGHVMPYCYGSVCAHQGEDDILACTCDPADPIVQHVDLVARTRTLQALLEDKRRARRQDRLDGRRLLQLAMLMRSAGQQGQRQAWDEVA